MLNLDTHVLLFALAGRLTKREEELLSNDTWSISAMVLWEVSKLRQLGRIELDLERKRVQRIFRRLHTWPLTWSICRQSCSLDIAGDPADELISATSVVHQIPLVTRDRAIRRSKIVPLAL